MKNLITIIPLASKVHSQEIYSKTLRSYVEVFSKYSDVKLLDVITSVSDVEKLLRRETTKYLALVFLTGGTSSLARYIVKTLRKKFVTLIAHGSDNSLPSALSCKGRLEIAGVKTHMLFSANPEDIANEFNKLYRILHAIYAAKTMRIALIYDNKKSSDALEFERKIGAKVIPVSPSEVNEEMDNISISDVERTLKKVLKGIRTCLDKELFYEPLKFYMAVKNIIKKKGANAATINCFKFITEKNITPCIAVALLVNEGIPFACEEDYHSLLLLTIANKLHTAGWIANPSLISKDHVVFAHCTIAPKLTENLCLLEHFETGKPASLSGKLRGNVEYTIARISYDYKSVFAATATLAKSGLISKRMCRTQAYFKLKDMKPSEFLEKAKGNHHVIMPGNMIYELKVISKVLD
ncbi:MAG: hypothetical protein DRO23_09715, partial [Thermoprotei archaeon]